MELSDKKIKEITRRIMASRMRILINNGFYGLLLMHMKISISDSHDTAWTDCRDRIWFNPYFVDTLMDKELDFVLMHEIVHAVLRHSFRKGEFRSEVFNIAADIIVNSNILLSNNGDEASITLKDYGVSMHLAPDGSEGHTHTLEELCHILDKLIPPDFNTQNGSKNKDGSIYEDSSKNEDSTINKDSLNNKDSSKNKKSLKQKGKDYLKSGFDYHPLEQYRDEKEENEIKRKWDINIRKACEAIAHRGKNCGDIPAFAERYMKELRKAQTDWRQLLNEFVQEEICDYSFTPPDKRLQDSIFLLPDYNEHDYKIGKILFMVDTSGSMSDEAITNCYAEIKGAIEQYNGKIEGLLGFFDAVVIPPIPFDSVDELIAIRPYGGGGTSFSVTFQYIRENMEDELPESIVILTDGYAPFPKEEEAMDIPVLWIINNEEVTPGWGKVARIS